MKKLYSIFLISLLTITLTGCGFHLRGHEPLPPQLKVLFLQTAKPFSKLTKDLQRVFHRSGVLLTCSSHNAPITLQIMADNFTQSTSSIGSSGQVTTYILNYTILYQLLDSSGHVLVPPQTITSARSYAITSNQLLSNVNALSGLQDEMRREIIYQLLDRLRAPIVLQALNRAQ